MKKILFYILILGFVLGGSARVQADTSYTLLEPLPCIPGTGQNCTNTNTTISTITQVNIDQYINYVIKLALAIAVFLATVEIIWGGFEWMVSAVPYVKVEGKKRIADAVFGLLAVLGSWLVLRTIDPRLVLVNTQLPVICPQGMTAGICDMSTLSKLEKAYTDSLRSTGNEQQLKALQTQQAVNDLDKQKNDLDLKFQRGELDEMTYKNQLAEISMGRDKLLSEGNLALGNYEMSDTFQKAVQAIQSGPLTADQIKGYRDQLDALYNKYKATPGLTNDPAALQKLDLARKMFAYETGDENMVATKLADYTKLVQTYQVTGQTSIGTEKPFTKPLDESRTALTATTRAKYEAELKLLNDPNYIPITTLTLPGPTTLDQAQQPPAQSPTLPLTSVVQPPPVVANDKDFMEFFPKVKNDPVLAPIYKTILQTKIDQINTVTKTSSPTSATPLK